MLQTAYPDCHSNRQRWIGFAFTVGAHAIVLAALMSYAPARHALAAAIPIMVSLVTPPGQPKEEPKEIPKPLPIRAKELPPPMPPVVAAENTPAPTPYIVPVQPEPPKLAPPIEAPLALASPPVIPPRFDAAYLDNPAPAYPALARRMREQGKVTLRVLVSAAGTTERVEIRASSGSGRLDRAAEETVRRWRFVPAKQGTQAVSAWVLVPISFVLEG
jgi:protein TonB